MCDAAEIVWGALEDRRDQLRLLAVLAQGLGAKGMRSYEPPSAAIGAALAELADDKPDRHREVTEFIIKAGGEAG